MYKHLKNIQVTDNMEMGFFFFFFFFFCFHYTSLDINPKFNKCYFKNKTIISFKIF